MELSTKVTPDGPGRITWVVRDERYELGRACSDAHTHASGHVRYPVAATGDEVNEAWRTAGARAQAARRELLRHSYGRRDAAKHPASCER